MMISNLVRDKLYRRWTAHENLIKIAFYHGVDPAILQGASFPTLEDYISNETIGLTLVDEDRFVLKYDKNAMNFIRPDGSKFSILYIDSKPGSTTITKDSLKTPLLNFLRIVEPGLDLSDAKDRTVDFFIDRIQGSTVQGTFSIDLNIQLILYSENPIQSSMFNIISNYNSMIKYPIKHFTIEQLQYNPTTHITGPRVMRPLSQAEVEDLVMRQVGLKGEYGIEDLGHEYLKRMNDNRDNLFEFEKARTGLIEHILSKLPTINSTDPWVKWRGFKLGDILYIERRIGPTLVCYRRVVELDKEVYQESKTKSAVKINKVNTAK